MATAANIKEPPKIVKRKGSSHDAKKSSSGTSKNSKGINYITHFGFQKVFSTWHQSLVKKRQLEMQYTVAVDKCCHVTPVL